MLDRSKSRSRSRSKGRKSRSRSREKRRTSRSRSRDRHRHHDSKRDKDKKERDRPKDNSKPPAEQLVPAAGAPSQMDMKPDSFGYGSTWPALTAPQPIFGLHLKRSSSNASHFLRTTFYSYIPITSPESFSDFSLSVCLSFACILSCEYYGYFIWNQCHFHYYIFCCSINRLKYSNSFTHKYSRIN